MIKIAVAGNSLIAKGENKIVKKRIKTPDIGLLVTIFILLRTWTYDGA